MSVIEFIYIDATCFLFDPSFFWYRPISIASFQNSSSVPNGRSVGDKLSIFNDIVFNSGSTSPPSDVPSWESRLTKILLFFLVCLLQKKKSTHRSTPTPLSIITLLFK